MKLSEYLDTLPEENVTVNPPQRKTWKMSDYLNSTDPVRARSEALDRSAILKASKENNKKRGFWGNIAESFKRGDINSEISQMKMLAKQGIVEYDSVKAIVDYQRNVEMADPIESENVITDALYAVSGMLPAIFKGGIEGAGTGAIAGTGAAIAGQLGPQALAPEEVITVPVAYAAGQMYGSFDYWRRQGEGDLWWEMQEEQIPRDISDAVSSVGGALYGAIEFSQVLKLAPAQKEATKQLVKATLKKNMGYFAKRMGADYVKELAEEGMQEIVIVSSKEVAQHMAGEQDEELIEILKNVGVSGWDSVKQSALPM
jgi:hypothetical protein